MTDNDLHEEFEDWLDLTRDRRICNAWLKTGTYAEAYVRRSVRLWKDALTPFVDIASVTVYPAYQRQGVFTAFLTYAELQCPRLFIEQVLTPRFQAYFDRRPGYVKQGISYYWETPHADVPAIR
jgi:GNAT superfamily N-acetyltransferase